LGAPVSRDGSGAAGYVSVLGNRLYREVHGAGGASDAVLFLHGGFGTIEAFGPQISALSPARSVHAYERPGHGRSADVDGPYSYEHSLAEAVAYLDAEGLGAVHVVGYSDGAILGLLLALRHPERVRRLVAISANLDPSGFGDTDAGAPVLPARDSRVEAGVSGTSFEQDLERYRRFSPDGPEHADAVLEKLMTLWRAEPNIAPEALADVAAPVLVMAGDRDSIRVDHSLLIAASLPNAELCIVPGASHGLVAERPALISLLIAEFLA
jgi:pimeloyl-ACP methyl ester carboxylesterase